MRLLMLVLGLLCQLCCGGEPLERHVTNSFVNNAMTNRWLSGKDGLKRRTLEKEFGFPPIVVSKISTNFVLQNTLLFSVSVQRIRISGIDDYARRETYAVVYNEQGIVFVESDNDAISFINNTKGLADNLYLRATQAVLLFGELRGYSLGTRLTVPISDTNNSISVWSVVMREDVQGCSVSASFVVSPSKVVRDCERYIFAFNNDGQMVLVKHERL